MRKDVEDVAQMFVSLMYVRCRALPVIPSLRFFDGGDPFDGERMQANDEETDNCMIGLCCFRLSVTTRQSTCDFESAWWRAYCTFVFRSLHWLIHSQPKECEQVPDTYPVTRIHVRGLDVMDDIRVVVGVGG